MSRVEVEEVRAEAQKLFDQATVIENADERLVLILLAMELETKADTLERGDEPVPTPYLLRGTGGSNRKKG